MDVSQEQDMSRPMADMGADEQDMSATPDMATPTPDMMAMDMGGQPEDMGEAVDMGGGLEEVAEQETNNGATADDFNDVSPGQVITGALSEPGDIDIFKVDAQAGKAYSFDLVVDETSDLEGHLTAIVTHAVAEEGHWYLPLRRDRVRATLQRGQVRPSPRACTLLRVFFVRKESLERS